VITAEALLRMLAQRTADPQAAIVEAALLRASMDRMGDFLAWLELHLSDEHGELPGAEACIELVALTHRRLRAELDLVDHTMADRTGSPFSAWTSGPLDPTE
jgi:hypothetical protein